MGLVGKGVGFPLHLRRHLGWCEIVHSHLLRADAATALSAALFGATGRLISGKHNDERALTRPLVSRIHGLMGRLPRRTIVLSDHVGRFIEAHGRVPLGCQTRIYYGIDRTEFEVAAAMPDPSNTAKRRRIDAAAGAVRVIVYGPEAALRRAVTERGGGVKWMNGSFPSPRTAPSCRVCCPASPCKPRR